MNDLHAAFAVRRLARHRAAAFDGRARERMRYDVVGPVCETGDTFAAGRANCRAAKPATC